MSRVRRGAKRALDITLCVLSLPVVVPVLAVCGLFIYLEDPGPVFYSQLRAGRGGPPFRMFKLRSMVTNAKELEAELAHLNELTPPDFKITNDPRVTRVGRLLRRTSLDELPQVFNVLRGEMSLVGPRPTCFLVEDYPLQHTERLEVKPGLTGLWQVSGRSEIDLDEKVRLDIEYIERQSLLFDLWLILKTFRAVISRRGAC